MQFQSRLARYYFEKYILEVAIATLENGGVATNPAIYQFLPTQCGEVVALQKVVQVEILPKKMDNGRVLTGK